MFLNNYYFQVNGIITLGENIADNGGVKQTYRVCIKHIVKTRKEGPQYP